MGKGAAGRIFISYRRVDTQHVAGRLFDRLETRFGVGKVFMDVVSINPGLDFAETIEEAVGACDVLLALIGLHWADAIDKHGNRRLEDPNDFVTLEITAALRRQIVVIPVLVDGAPPVRREDLPLGLATLARRQSIRLDHASFGADVAELVIALERVLPQAVNQPTDRSSADTRSDSSGGFYALPAGSDGMDTRDVHAVTVSHVPLRFLRAISARRRILSIALIVGMLIGGVAYIAGREGSTSPSGVLDRTVGVDSMIPWNDTGIDIAVESQVRFEASGIVYIAGSDNGKSPEGAPGCIGAGDRRQPPGPALAPGLTCLALVGKIGDNPPFEIGRSATVKAAAAGRLFLGINDNAFGDNYGAWTVRIFVSPHT